MRGSLRGGLEMTMDVLGTVELMNWVLGFSDKAEVLEPETLPTELALELKRAAALGNLDDSFLPD
jgi:hypothetical protein